MPSKYKYVFLSKSEDSGYAIDEFNHEHNLVNCNNRFKKKYVEQHKLLSLYGPKGEYHLLEIPDDIEGDIIYYETLPVELPTGSKEILERFMKTHNRK